MLSKKKTIILLYLNYDYDLTSIVVAAHVVGYLPHGQMDSISSVRAIKYQFLHSIVFNYNFSEI